MFTLKRSLTIGLAFSVLLISGCHNEKTVAQGTTIKADKKVELVTKHEGEQRPYFRATLKFKNPDGSDADVKLPDTRDDTLRKSFKITTTAKKTGQQPFYVVKGAPTITDSATQSEIRHDILLLFDVSGSMNFDLSGKKIEANPGSNPPPSRFDLAKDAAKTLMGTLGPGYRVAIAPFQSRQVAAKFENLQFRSPQDAASEIRDLSRPDDKGNTALYSAIEFAVETMKKRRAEAQDQSLIVLTDGKNDVDHPQDDPGLLKGDEGFLKVKNKLKDDGIRTFTIGVGQPSQGKGDLAYEEEKLQELASSQDKFFKAEKLNDLRITSTAVQQAVSRTVTITFCTNDKNLKDLRSLNFNISYNAPGIGTIRGVIPWVCNSIAGCVPSGILTSQEMSELGKGDCEGGTGSAWQQILWLFGQLALFSGGIAVLWMFLPSLIWPSVPLPSLPSRGKQKASPPPPKPSSRSSSSSSSSPPDRATPSKPRQRFEETRIHDNPGRRDQPRDR